MDFKLFSPSFKDGELIPPKYTCDGANISPPLSWTTPPEKTKSFAIIVDDPDAPVGAWVHWILFNIPSDARELIEESSSKHNLPKGTIEGTNDFRKNNYGGPCPPSGTHRYFFKLYALDLLLPLKESTTKKQLLDAMKGHILAEAILIGKYNRQR
ncbi:MAG: YbhB/YbcL family Raf kinase inhibitor-like protein [Ignavibacteriales bacterium]|nr:YbhB/YbcL family Raf kinase inhibitor-like protein [Ignavibacteriales bacterium]